MAAAFRWQRLGDRFAVQYGAYPVAARSLETMRTSKIAFYTSLGLFVVSLVLPAVDLTPWLDGWRVFILSFLGLILSLDMPKHFAACLMGASANALMLLAYFRIWKGRSRGTPLAATTAVMFTLLVLVPLASITGVRASKVVSFGYYVWVAAAVTLAISAWLQSGEMVKSAKLLMKSLSPTWLIIPCLLGLIILPVQIKESWKAREAARCATEGQAAVEAFLRDGAGGAFTNAYGSFLSLEGSGYFPPVWNIQGYHYLTLERTGRFSGHSLPIRIYVTEGRVTAPGLKTVGKPKIEGPISPIQGARIFVAHPEVKQ